MSVDLANKIGYSTIICVVCQLSFERKTSQVIKGLKANPQRKFLCSLDCKKQWKNKSQTVTCAHCQQSFVKKHSALLKTNKNFCSRKCAMIYNNGSSWPYNMRLAISKD